MGGASTTFWPDPATWAAMNSRRFLRLLYVAAVLLLLTEVVAYLGVMPHLRPVSLQELTANILFAIGFGCPLVLYLSSLPPLREVAAVAVVGGVLALGVWQVHRVTGVPAEYKPEEVAVAEVVTGLGLASLAAMALLAWRSAGRERAAALAFLLPATVAMLVTVEAGIFLYFVKGIYPTSRDPSAYAADAAFGFQLSFALGRVFTAAPLLQLICFAIYVAPPPTLVFVYALQTRARRTPPVDAATVLLAVLATGYALYFLFPVCGPLFAFRGAFPEAPPPLGDLLGTRMAVPGADAWPNGMPSLHLASVVVAYWLARPYGPWARAAAAVFLVGTFLATLGTGEHYFIDLVVAMPLTLAVYAACMPPRPAYARQRAEAIGVGLILLGGWYALLLQGLEFLLLSPTIAWGIALGSTVTVLWLERRLYDAAFADPEPKPSAGTAPGPRGHFLIGNLLAFRRDVLGLLVNSRREFGDVVRFRLGPMLIHLVSHPDHIKQVLVTHQNGYNKDTRSSSKIVGITGEGLLTSNGDAWLRQRRLMQPVFNAQSLAGYTGVIAEVTDRMLDAWEACLAAGQAVEVASQMTRLTCTIVARILLGADVSGDIEAVERSATILVRHTWRRLERILDLPLWMPTPENLQFRAARHQLDQIVFRLIAERRSGEPRADLLALLLKARDDVTGRGMTEKQLHNETLTLLLAGHETTANALSWTWFLLSQHPRWRESARDEVTGLLGERAPSVEHLSRLDLVTRVFQEAMRLYPPIWIMERRVLEDDEIGGYAIPAGSALEISPYVTHRHPDFWNDPDGFDPDRFTAQRSGGRPQYAYLPFGGGQRLCIGNNLAMLEARVIVSRVLQRFRLELAPGAVVEPLPGITLRLRRGLPMTLHRAKP
jgi:cytochrome P450